MTKQCKGPCGETLPLTEFYDHPGTSDHKQRFCKGCSKSRMEKWRADKRQAKEAQQALEIEAEASLRWEAECLRRAEEERYQLSVSEEQPSPNDDEVLGFGLPEFSSESIGFSTLYFGLREKPGKTFSWGTW